MTKPLYSPYHICHCGMGCCQASCNLLSVLTQVYVYINVMWVASGVTSFIHTDAEMLRFCGMYGLKITVPFNFTMTLSTAKCLEGMYYFEKFTL